MTELSLSHSRATQAALLAVATAALLPACDGPQLNGRQTDTLIAMALPAEAPSPPPSPSNTFADSAAAAALGERLFNDKAMSADGQVACASCHVADQGWSDDRRVSLGAFNRVGSRHSMPILGASRQRWWFWDGRTDSMWSQAIAAIESTDEMDFTRAEVAHFVAQRHRQAYEAVFGPLPGLGGVPARGRPGMAAWDALPKAKQSAVERVFVNVGKALEAYERTLDCRDTRFDRWARDEVTMTQQEEAGAVAFVNEGCTDCHSGPDFSDGKFHNIGIGSNTDEPDKGRASGLIKLALSEFNAAGIYSDDRQWGQQRLAAASAEQRTLGAFKTPTLRGVAQRRSFSHRGDHAGLNDILRHYDDVRPQGSAVGELDPLVEDVDLERVRAVAAFLEMLDCPTP